MIPVLISFSDTDDAYDESSSDPELEVDEGLLLDEDDRCFDFFLAWTCVVFFLDRRFGAGDESSSDPELEGDGDLCLDEDDR